jgi:hypothetical protein
MDKMQSEKIEIEKFIGKNNFELQKVKMQDVLVQQGVAKALLGKSKKPVSMTDEEWEDVDVKALNVIRLCLADNVLFNNVADKTIVGLWTKLERLYINKSFTNMIFLKRKL